MKALALATVAAAVSLVTSIAMAGTGTYPGFAVSLHGQAKPVFQFSSAQATAEDPVVISIAGRQLRPEDSKYRVDLQKLWLQRNVPDSYKLRIRDLSFCPKRHPNQFGACDRYEFTDANGAVRQFYFYVGNWP